MLSDLVFTREPPIDSGLGDIKVSAHLRHRVLTVNAQASELNAQHRRVRIRVQPNDLRCVGHDVKQGAVAPRLTQSSASSPQSDRMDFTDTGAAGFASRTTGSSITSATGSAFLGFSTLNSGFAGAAALG